MAKRTLTVQANIKLTGLSAEVLGLYRALRKAGFSRRDANLMVSGIVIGTDAGIIDVRVLNASVE